MKEKTVTTISLNPAIDETVIINNFSIGKVNRANTGERHAGGKGVNVATFLSDYGIDVIACGFLGKQNDAIFHTHFKNKNISDAFIRIEGHTRSDLKIVDPLSNTTTDINYPGAIPNNENLQNLFNSLELLCQKSTAVVLSGSLPPNTSTKIYNKLIQICKLHNAITLLDTTGEALFNAIEAAPTIIKPNIYEFEELFSTKFETYKEIIQKSLWLLSKGILQVVVSLGRQGALFINSQNCTLAIPPKVKVRSTVGAGDAMVAGIICAQMQKLSQEETARLSTVFSVKAISSIELGFLKKNELAGMDKQVQVHSYSVEDSMWEKSINSSFLD